MVLARPGGNSLQELEETAYWLELLIESDLVRKEMVESLLDETNELIAILVSSINTAKQRVKRLVSVFLDIFHRIP